MDRWVGPTGHLPGRINLLRYLFTGATKKGAPLAGVAPQFFQEGRTPPKLARRPSGGEKSWKFLAMNFLGFRAGIPEVTHYQATGVPEGHAKRLDYRSVSAVAVSYSGPGRERPRTGTTTLKGLLLKKPGLTSVVERTRRNDLLSEGRQPLFTPTRMPFLQHLVVKKEGQKQSRAACGNDG